MPARQGCQGRFGAEEFRSVSVGICGHIWCRSRERASASLLRSERSTISA